MRSSIKLTAFFLMLYTLLSAGSINEELFNKAEKFYSSKSYDNALKIYENLLKEEEFKDRELLLFHLGSSYSYLRKEEKAYRILSVLFKEYPQTIYYKNSLKIMIDYLKSKKEFQAALDLLEEKSVLLKGDDDIKKMILELYEYNGSYLQALELLEKEFPLTLWSFQKKVYYLRELKRYDDAISYTREHLSRYNNIELYQSLADLYELKKDYKESMAWYMELYKRTNNINYIINQSRMLFSNNIQDLGKESVSFIFEKLGDNIGTYKQVAEIYKEYGLYEELLVLYDSGIKKGYDFQKEKINVYEVMGKYEKAVYEYLKLLDKNQISFITDKLYNLALYEDQFELIEKLLVKYEEDFPNKKQLILQIEISLNLKLGQFNKIQTALMKKYFPGKNIDQDFLENIINALFNKGKYDHIINIYDQIPGSVKARINAVVQLRYAQSLYMFNKYTESLDVLNSFKQSALQDVVKYYKALNYTGLKKYDTAIGYVRKYSSYEAFDLYLKLLILQGQFNKAKDEIRGEIKKNKYPKSNLLFYQIVVNIFLNESEIVVTDMKKYLEVYPHTREANDCVSLLFLLNNEFIKSDKGKKEQVLAFYKYYYIHDYNKAVDVLKNITVKDTNLKSVISFYLSMSFYYLDEYKRCVTELKEIIKQDTFIKPYALELLGWIYLNKLQDKETAKKYYNDILASYPSFINVNNIRKLIAE